MTVGVETPNELMVVFSNTVSAGFDALQGSVNGVFGLMIALVVALTGIQWALSSNREVLASGFMKILLIGVFAWLINDWQRLSETIYAGFIELGLTAGGGSLVREEFLNPGAVLAQGWEIVKALGETPAPVDDPLDVVGNITDALILGLAMIGIMLAFAVLALQIIVALLEFKIVTLGGFVLLPFGIWSKSAFLAERPLGYVVSSGLKVLALAIVVSGARTIFDQLQPSANPDIYEALSILVAALLLAMLAIFIPNLASALVTGGPALGAGAAVTGALAVGGATVAAGAGLAAVAVAGAKGAGPARAAAGAGAGRPPTTGPKPTPTPTPPKTTPPTAGSRGAVSTAPMPSNDNRTPRGAGRAVADRAKSGKAASGSSGASKPAVSPGKPPQPATAGASTGSPAKGSRTTASTPPAATVAAEKETACQDFHKAAARPGETTTRGAGQSSALRAFFVANAGRGLLPSSETSGVLNPSLRTEET
ncbi:P-type conjugative transfer protein TrbL [Brevundimonas sp.]|uniref:P-type conjugative transfer protein TrbL n=1 Tax=Brevundimonas sp. TaxID=1871086 RepID=UPI0035691F0B